MKFHYYRVLCRVRYRLDAKSWCVLENSVLRLAQLALGLAHLALGQGVIACSCNESM